jgi:hypothetical protein
LVKVQPKTSESYRTSIKALAEKHMEFHTYKLKEERSYRIPTVKEEICCYSFQYSAGLSAIWIYGIQLWYMASTSNIESLEHFQSKTLHLIVDTPWYVPNTVVRRDLQIPTVKEEICCYSSPQRTSK